MMYNAVVGTCAQQGAAGGGGSPPPTGTYPTGSAPADLGIVSITEQNQGSGTVHQQSNYGERFR